MNLETNFSFTPNLDINFGFGAMGIVGIIFNVFLGLALILIGMYQNKKTTENKGKAGVVCIVIGVVLLIGALVQVAFRLLAG